MSQGPLYILDQILDQNSLHQINEVFSLLPEKVSYKKLTFIKSPRSGITLCFQFVSAASASAAAKTFPSHVKTI